MRCASELSDSLDSVHIKFLNLERELSILLLVNDFSSKIFLKCIDVLSDSVGVLLGVAISFEPEIVWLTKNDEVFWGVADLVVSRILCLVLDFVGQRKQESFLVLLVASNRRPRSCSITAKNFAALRLDDRDGGSLVVTKLMEATGLVGVSVSTEKKREFRYLVDQIKPLDDDGLFWKL